MVLRTEGILGNVGTVGRVWAERQAERKSRGYFFCFVLPSSSLWASRCWHSFTGTLCPWARHSSSYFLREHFHAVYKGDVCSITWSTLRMLPTTWWQLGGKQEGVLPCSRALQQDTRSLWSSAFTWVLTTAFSATTPLRREASKHGGGMMRGNWKIRSKSAGRGEALHPPPPQTLAPSTKHVNIAAGHLTPFPRDALVYTGGTPSWRFICATFPAPSIPPLHHHYLSHLFSVHSSSGGNIKMRCVHSESAVTISSPPSLFLCAVFFLHTWPSLTKPRREAGKTLLAGSWNMTLWYSPGWEWVCSNVTYQSEVEEEQGGRRGRKRGRWWWGGLMRKSIPKLHFSILQNNPI